MMTARQERALRLAGVRALVERQAYADAHDRMGDVVALGRTDRWRRATILLRIALHDAACGDNVDVLAALERAERAAT